MQISLLGSTQEGEIVTRKGCHHTEATRAKISAARLGIPSNRPGYSPSPETRAKLSAALSGKPNPHTGHSQSPETRAKIANTMTGKPHPCKSHPQTRETRAKISAARAKQVFSAETRAKMSAARRGKQCPHVGYNPTPETRAIWSSMRSGEDNPQWRGGISFEPYCPKFNDEFKRRVRAFFDYRCIMCGKHEQEIWEKLSVHHIEYNKSACCDGLPVQFAGLCRKHHSMTSHGDRQRWEDLLHRVIDEVYDGRSYFTKDEWANLSPAPASTHIQ